MGTLVIPAPAKYVRKSEIVDNLTSTSTTAPLSANMGKTLEEHVQQSTANFLAYGNTTRGKNLNDLRPTNGGIYMYNGYGSSDMTGTLPFTDSYGILFCGENGYGDYMQIMIKLTTGKVYRRTYQSGAWNAWSAPT